MSATVRKDTRSHAPRASGRTQLVTIGARGLRVNWSNKASPAQWRAKRRRSRTGR